MKLRVRVHERRVNKPGAQFNRVMGVSSMNKLREIQRYREKLTKVLQQPNVEAFSIEGENP